MKDAVRTGENYDTSSIGSTSRRDGALDGRPRTLCRARTVARKSCPPRRFNRRDSAKGGARLFRLATEASPSGTLLVNDQGRILLVNAHVEELFGYEREELIGKRLRSSFRNDLRQSMRPIA